MADPNSMSIEELEAELAGFSATPVPSSNFDLSSFGAGIGSVIPGVGPYLGSGLAEALNSTIGTSNLRQLGYDVPSGLLKGTLSLPDLFAMGSNKLNSYLPYFKDLPQLQLASTPVDRLAETLGVEPNSTTQEIINFMTPMPGNKAEVAKDIALGGMSYLGSKVGQAADEDSPFYSLLGGLGLPAASLFGLKAAAIGGSGLKEAFNTGRAALGNEAMLREMAAQPLITAAGDAGMARIATAQELESLLYSPSGARMTFGELAQSPGGAAAQSQLAQDVVIGSRIRNALEERKVPAAKAMSSLGTNAAPGVLAGKLNDRALAESLAATSEQTNILENLGLTSEARATTQLGRGEVIRGGILTEMDLAEETVLDAWKAVPRGVKVDIAKPLYDFLKETRENYGPLEKSAFSADLKKTIKQSRRYLMKDDGMIDTFLLQDLRKFAGQAMTDAYSAGKNGQGRALARLRDLIDNEALNAASVGRVAPEALDKLGQAIAATRSFKDKYESEVVGKITETKRNTLVVKDSQVLLKAQESPESLKEFITKFGKDSPQYIEIRQSLLAQLEASKNPADFFTKKKDNYIVAFGDDLPQIKSYVKSRSEPGSLQQFSDIKDASIPGKVFESEKTAAAFAKQFNGTDILQMARDRFLSDLTKSYAGTGAKFAKLKTVAKGLFGDDFPAVEKIVADIESGASVDILATQASRGQSPTAQRLLTQAFLSGQPGREARLKAFVGGGGSLIGGALGGGPAGSLGAALGGFIGGPVGAGIGAVTLGALGGGIGYKFANRAAESLAEMNRMKAEMIVDPRLIPSAKTPVKKVPESVSRQIKRAAVLGERSLEDEQASPSSQDLNSMTVEELEKLLAEQPATKKDISLLEDINIVSKAEAEDKPTSKEIARLEKASKGFNVAKAIAGSSKMVQAVSRVESNLKHASISSRGAIGIMQLMPTTAEMLGVDPYDPSQNIKGGEKYLEQLRDRFKNDKLTFAAYNMGPTALAHAIRESGTRDWERMIKKLGVYNSKSNKKGIPAETIAYVPKVMKFYRK